MHVPAETGAGRLAGGFFRRPKLQEMLLSRFVIHCVDRGGFLGREIAFRQLAMSQSPIRPFHVHANA